MTVELYELQERAQQVRTAHQLAELMQDLARCAVDEDVEVVMQSLPTELYELCN